MQKRKDVKTKFKATIEETTERRRRDKRWRDEIERELNIMGMKNRQVMTTATATATARR